MGNEATITKKAQHSRPEITHAKLESDCPRILSPLPQSIHSRISAGTLAVSMSFFILSVGPPKRAFSSSEIDI